MFGGINENLNTKTILFFQQDIFQVECYKRLLQTNSILVQLQQHLTTFYNPAEKSLFRSVHKRNPL